MLPLLRFKTSEVSWTLNLIILFSSQCTSLGMQSLAKNLMTSTSSMLIMSTSCSFTFTIARHELKDFVSQGVEEGLEIARELGEFMIVNSSRKEECF